MGSKWHLTLILYMSVQVRVSVQDMRERLTMTKTTLGTALVTLDQLQASGN